MKVVVAYDGSEHAHKAVDQLKLLSGPVDAVLVSVVRGPALGIRGTAVEVDQSEIDAARDALQKMAKELAAGGRTVQTKLMMGEPADALIDEAIEQKADLIILGTRGLNLAKRIVMGSVSTNVLHHAPCSVLVVR